MDEPRTGEARHGRQGRVWLAVALVAALGTGTSRGQEAVAERPPHEVPALFSGRTASGRRAALRKYGGDRETEAAVLRALRWLKTTQNADGSWSRTQPEAMTGLCLLTFLARGKTPRSKEFGSTVQKAVTYLSDKMTAYVEGAGGDLSRAYVNGVVTYALAETYGMTGLEYVKPAMEKGLDRIVRGQQPGGGFDYHYKKGARWDLSVTSWQVQALRVGYVARTENKGVMPALKKAQSFIQDTSFRKGKFGYSTPGSGSAGMQGAGTLCLQLIGQRKSGAARSGVTWIRKNDEVKWDLGKEYSAHSNPVYNWYYETQAMFHAGKTHWSSWNKQMKKELVGAQKPGEQTEDGKDTGYWEAPGTWRKPEYDPWYSTALCTLSLQVYYRYSPTYEMPRRP